MLRKQIHVGISVHSDAGKYPIVRSGRPPAPAPATGAPTAARKTKLVGAIVAKITERGRYGVTLVNCLPDEHNLYSATEREGIDPIVTCDLSSAIDVARASRPAVVVTDFTLTNTTRLDLIGALCGDDRTRHAFIIVRSARAFPADRAGCDVFLANPVCL
jgi:hypothetical protein